MAVERPILTVKGKDYQGWTECSVTLTMEAASGSFRLGVTERDPESSQPFDIRTGDKCSVTLGDTSVISGYVNDVSVSYDAYSHSITVSGRDAAGDLVDCSASSGSWSGYTLDKIVSAISAPFGIGVDVQTDVGKPFSKFKITEGETAWSAIERACRMRGALCVSDGNNGIVLMRASTGASVAIVRGGVGGMILSATADFSDRERYSEYQVKGQSSGWDSDDVDGAAHAIATAKDSAVDRYRLKVVVAEDQGDSGTLSERANWEAKVARGRSQKAGITVFGWRDASGSLWLPNRLVRVECDWLRLVDEMMISTVTLSQSGLDGTTADLVLVHPDTFAAEPIVEREDVGW